MKLHTMIVTSDKSKPRIRLPQKLLEDAGFELDTIVTLAMHDDILTIKAEGKGLDVYERLVSDIRKNGHQLETVSYDRSVKGFHLLMTGDFLLSNGFKTGDIILIGYEKGIIKIKRLCHTQLGFEDITDMKNKIFTVHTVTSRKKKIPTLELKARWLENMGFEIGNSITVSHVFDVFNEDMLLLEADGAQKTTSDKTYLRSIKLRASSEKLPRFQLMGHFLKEDGFNLGDKVIVRYGQGFMMIKTLDLDKFGF